MPEFIEAVAKSTGRKQRIPAAWMDHPVLGEGFRQTPRNTARTAPAEKRTAKARKAAQPKAPAAGDNHQAPPAGDKE